MRILLGEGGMSPPAALAWMPREGGDACVNGNEAVHPGATVADIGLPRADGPDVIGRWRGLRVALPVLTARISWSDNFATTAPRVFGVRPGAKF